MKLKPEALLARYVAERDALLSRIEAVLQDDPRVCAAWLWGSLGRRETDALSDIDLWVVVDDDILTKVTEERQAYVRQVQDPLLILEAPQNAPVRGAYLCAVYGCEVGTLHTDWYWQARSAAWIPPDVTFLLERAPLPRSDEPPTFPGTDQTPARAPIKAAGHRVRSFWVMLPIAAKYAARRSTASQEFLIPMVLDSLAAVTAFVNAERPVETGTKPGIPDDPYAQLDFLADRMTEMAGLMVRATEQGVDVPDPAILSHVVRYLDVARAKLDASL